MDRISTQKAAEIVNANATRITGTLRASGSVDGYFTTPEGRLRNYHVDGTLFYLSPCYFRFDLKTLGDRQILLGSNADYYWFYSKQDDSYYCGLQGSDEEVPAEFPVRPDQVMDALALVPIGNPDSRDPNRDAEGRLQWRKEYWSDCNSPQFIRRVSFRDPSGVMVMETTLDRYKALTLDGPSLPYAIIARWPVARAQMRFRIDKWTLVQQVLPSGPQFATPAECFTGEGPTPHSTDP